MTTDTQQNSDIVSSEQASKKPKYEDAVKRNTNCCQSHCELASTPPHMYTVTFSEYQTYTANKQQSACITVSTSVVVYTCLFCECDTLSRHKQQLWYRWLVVKSRPLSWIFQKIRLAEPYFRLTSGLAEFLRKLRNLAENTPEHYKFGQQDRQIETMKFKI